MMNYIVIDNEHIQIANGIFGDVSSFHTYASGELESVRLEGKNMVLTNVGELVPTYTENQRRKNKPSVEFHKNGLVKAVSLEDQTEVETPIGTLPIERITFYPTGEVHRVFITDGQISGFWSEKDEKEYNIPLTFEFGFSDFTAHVSGICFYKSGGIRSVTLYPGEKITVKTPAGEVETGIGFSLYENGKLSSVEPASPIIINTPIGQFLAYDPEAIGVHADSNSVCFDTQGRLSGFSTVDNRILVQTDKEEFLILKPEEGPHPLHDDETVKMPMKIAFDFDKDIVMITSDKEREFSRKTTKFTIKTIETGELGCSPSDCASCSLCSTKNNSMK